MTTNVFAMADTWNNGATSFRAIKMDVTNSASAASSKLLDLLIGGVPMMQVDKTGVVWSGIAAGAGSGLALVIGGDPADSSVGIAVYLADSTPALTFWRPNFGGKARLACLDVALNGAGFVSAYNDTLDIFAPLNANGLGNAWELIEVTAPPAPAANKVRLYAQDNGGGKTQLMALFSSGAAQQVAIQP